jgi:hypothetical protein
MMQDQRGSPQEIDEKLNALLKQLRSIVETQVISTLEWYKSHATWPRVVFRTAGTCIILLSISIPILATHNYPGKETLLSIFALLIAALTGLNAFFKWEETWKSRRQTEFALSHLLAIWDLKMIEALHETDPHHAVKIAITATEKLVNDARTITGAETEEFFRNIQWPQVDTKKA